MNGQETGVDCSGSCLRICQFNVIEPKVLWVEAFKIVDGQYNAVAYIENRNEFIGAPNLDYVFKLHDDSGLIAERNGRMTLPIDGAYPLFEGKILTGDRIPKNATIEFIGDTVWLKGESGGEQFTLLHRELIDADKKPRLNTVIKNDGLFESKDVEIIATIFDSKKNPLTASRTYVEYFAGRSNKEVVFTWPEPIATTLRSCDVPTDVILAIDLSGSMNDDGDTPPEPISSVLNAAESFVKRLKSHDQSGLVTYATDSSLVEQLTSDHSRVAKIVSNLEIEPKEEVGGTNTGEAVKSIRKEIVSLRHNDDARKVAILLTDGLANTGGDDPEKYALREAEQLKELGVNLFTIGLGVKVNTDFLKSLASSNDQYYNAPTTNELSSIYQKITAAICEDGASVIEVIPKVESSFPEFPGS